MCEEGGRQESAGRVDETAIMGGEGGYCLHERIKPIPGKPTPANPTPGSPRAPGASALRATPPHRPEGPGGGGGGRTGECVFVKKNPPHTHMYIPLKGSFFKGGGLGGRIVNRPGGGEIS